MTWIKAFHVLCWSTKVCEAHFDRLAPECIHPDGSLVLISNLLDLKLESNRFCSNSYLQRIIVKTLERRNCLFILTRIFLVLGRGGGGVSKSQ